MADEGGRVCTAALKMFMAEPSCCCCCCERFCSDIGMGGAGMGPDGGMPG
jgi:hypothetical protein